VPGVIGSGRGETTEWLLTAGLPGRDATGKSFRGDTAGLVTLLTEGLRQFHDAPASACPFQFRIADALRTVGRRLKTGKIDANRDFHEEHAHLSPAEAFDQLLGTSPGREDLVVCHGGYCLPNVLIDRGEVVGYLDVGELGVADRWWDLAVASWSVIWNLGPGHEDLFFRSYGVEPDAVGSDSTASFMILYHEPGDLPTPHTNNGMHGADGQPSKLLRPSTAASL
jgi:kanamycin kinase